MTQMSEAYFRQLMEDFGSLRQRVDRLERLETKVYAPGARITHSANQSTTNNTNFTLAYDTSIENDSGYWSSGANTKLTIPAGYGGRHLVTLSLRWAANAVGYRLATIQLNGATPLAIDIRDSGASEVAQAISFTRRFVAGDYIESYVRQTSGGALAVAALSEYSPVLTITRLGD